MTTTNEKSRPSLRQSPRPRLPATKRRSRASDFEVKGTPEREARNPATGATIKVAAAKKLTFTPAKALKDALNT